MDDKTSRSHTPFDVEVDRRECHLAGLPGRVYRDWLKSLNRASEVFSGNSAELERHLTQFIGKPKLSEDLPKGFDVEANRLLHNYLASMATLRDIQRMVHHKLWPERFAPDSKTDRRTIWEVEILQPKREVTGQVPSVPCY